MANQEQSPDDSEQADLGNYPTATNPKTGETIIYKDGKWQKP
jgi:hypothetical protein